MAPSNSLRVLPITSKPSSASFARASAWPSTLPALGWSNDYWGTNARYGARAASARLGAAITFFQRDRLVNALPDSGNAPASTGQMSRAQRFACRHWTNVDAPDHRRIYPIPRRGCNLDGVAAPRRQAQQGYPASRHWSSRRDRSARARSRGRSRLLMGHRHPRVGSGQRFLEQVAHCNSRSLRGTANTSLWRKAWAPH